MCHAFRSARADRARRGSLCVSGRSTAQRRRGQERGRGLRGAARRCVDRRGRVPLCRCGGGLACTNGVTAARRRHRGSRRRERGSAARSVCPRSVSAGRARHEGGGGGPRGEHKLRGREVTRAVAAGLRLLRPCGRRHGVVQRCEGGAGRQRGPPRGRCRGPSYNPGTGACQSTASSTDGNCSTCGCAGSSDGGSRLSARSARSALGCRCRTWLRRCRSCCCRRRVSRPRVKVKRSSPRPRGRCAVRGGRRNRRCSSRRSSTGSSSRSPSSTRGSRLARRGQGWRAGGSPRRRRRGRGRDRCRLRSRRCASGGGAKEVKLGRGGGCRRRRRPR